MLCLSTSSAGCCCSHPTTIVEALTISFSLGGLFVALAIVLCLSCVALSHFVHEITGEHRLSHLLILAHFAALPGSARTEACFGLIELWLVSDVWQHLMNPGIVGGL